MDKIKNKINEMNSLLQLPEYAPIVEDIIKKIYDSGCQLMFYIGQSKHQETPNYCIICLNNSESNKLELLWNLLHEFGHHEDPNKLKKEDENNDAEKQRREKAAWFNADRHFLSYPRLADKKDEYVQHRDKCLKSYKIVDYVGLL